MIEWGSGLLQEKDVSLLPRQREFSRRTISNSRRVKSLRHPGCMHYAYIGDTGRKMSLQPRKRVAFTCCSTYTVDSSCVYIYTCFSYGAQIFNIIVGKITRRAWIFPVITPFSRCTIFRKIVKGGGREKFFSLLFPLESNWIRIKLIVGRHVTFVRLSFRSRLIAGTGQGKLKNCWAARFHGLNIYIYIYIFGLDTFTMVFRRFDIERLAGRPSIRWATGGDEAEPTVASDHPSSGTDYPL